MTTLRLTSRQNPLLQHVRKLQASRAYRQRCGEFVADGTKLLEEAAKWCDGLQTVILSDDVLAPPLPESVQVVRVPPDVMQSISAMQTPQGALFVCKYPPERPFALTPGTLVLDRIQDPGNVGTILRTADALEIPVVLTSDCADPYNAKTVRASMGAVFRIPPQLASREEILQQSRERGIDLAVMVLSERAVDIRQANLSDCAVVIGSEGQGVSQTFLQAARRELIIPMNARCESLNAAVAAVIVMWQMKI